MNFVIVSSVGVKRVVCNILQGKSMLDTCCRVFSNLRSSDIAKLLPHKHQPVIFGAVCGMLGIKLHPTMMTFLFSTVRTVIASAVRLDKIGPIEVSSSETRSCQHLLNLKGNTHQIINIVKNIQLCSLRKNSVAK